MALSRLEYTLLSTLADRDLFSSNPSVLEFGEQHWHGDVPLVDLAKEIIKRSPNPQKRDSLLQNLQKLSKVTGKGKNFDIAKIVYQVFLGYASINAIDLHGTDSALPIDLNYPIDLDKTFDICINLGTGEHIFNTYQFFKTVHELTRPGGLMIHGMPFTGWIDHGFYNFNPTLYWDLAFANQYEVVCSFMQLKGTNLLEIPSHKQLLNLITIKGYPENANLYFVFRKSQSDSIFSIPQQTFFQVSTEAYWQDILDINNEFSWIDSFLLKPINLFITPNWDEPEAIADFLLVLAQINDLSQVALLVDALSYANDFCVEDFLSQIILNLLIEGRIQADSPLSGLNVVPFNSAFLSPELLSESRNIEQQFYWVRLTFESDLSSEKMSQLSLPTLSLSELLKSPLLVRISPSNSN